jgi:hypothetical protein
VAGARAEAGEEAAHEDGVEERHHRPRDRRDASAHRGAPAASCAAGEA